MDEIVSMTYQYLNMVREDGIQVCPCVSVPLRQNHSPRSTLREAAVPQKFLMNVFVFWKSSVSPTDIHMRTTRGVEKGLKGNVFFHRNSQGPIAWKHFAKATSTVTTKHHPPASTEISIIFVAAQQLVSLTV